MKGLSDGALEVLKALASPLASGLCGSLFEGFSKLKEHKDNKEEISKEVTRQLNERLGVSEKTD